jgi:hypothetical protein
MSKQGRGIGKNPILQEIPGRDLACDLLLKGLRGRWAEPGKHPSVLGGSEPAASC